MSFTLLSVCLCASGSPHLNFACISFLCPAKKIGSDWLKPADHRMRWNKEKLVGCIFSSLPLHHSPHLSISWQGVINLILGEIQGSTFYTLPLRNLLRLEIMLHQKRIVKSLLLMFWKLFPMDTTGKFPDLCGQQMAPRLALIIGCCRKGE